MPPAGGATTFAFVSLCIGAFRGVYGQCNGTGACTMPSSTEDLCSQAPTPSDCVFFAASGCVNQDPFGPCPYTSKPPGEGCTVGSQAGTCDGAGNCYVPGDAGSDPVFAGFHGDYYYVAGYKNATFAMLSDPRHQVNVLLEKGVENRTYTIWITAIGIKFLDEDFTFVINMPLNDAFYAGNPTYEVVINGQDATPLLFTGVTSEHKSCRVYFPPLEDDGWEFSWEDFNLISVNGTKQGELVSTSVVTVITPGYKLQIYMVIDTRPHKYHGPTPHFEMRTSILKTVDKELVSGWLGESLSWIGKDVPFMRGLLRSTKDSDYEVSGLLAHDFKFSTYGIKFSTYGEPPPQLEHLKGRSLI